MPDPGASVTLHEDPNLKPVGPVPAQDSHKDLGALQGEREVLDNDEQPAQSDATELIWPLLLVIAVLLSLVSQQFRPRNLASRSDDIARLHQNLPVGLEDQPVRCIAEVKLIPAPYSWLNNDPPRFHARGSMNIPVSTDIMSFVNMHGDDGCAGAFRVSQTGEPGSEAIVDVDVSYAQPGASNDVRVCRLHRAKHDVGEVFRLGIDTPATDGLDSLSNETRHRALHVDIHLRLPRAHAGSSLPLNIKELHTDLHQYDHLLSTPPSVHFKKLNLSTVLARIESESVSGDVVSLWSTYNGITGAYNISRALTIQTEDGLVNVTAQLHHHGASSDPTSLNITSIENAVFSQVSLHSPSPIAPQGNFSVTATTGHGSINLTFLSAPPAAVLTASVEIVGPDGNWPEMWGEDWDPSYWDPEWDFDPIAPSRATVQVHETFEGAIDLEMREPTAYRPAVVSYADVYAGAEAEVEAEVEGGVEEPEGGDRELDSELGVRGDGSCDARENSAVPDGLDKLLLHAGDGQWNCAHCACMRRVDADPGARDGRAVVGGISWGAERLSDEELRRRGKIIVRTVDSPIILIV
ncbi:hypothetical protein GSI_02115 [Ganoderma sinense ZZ0214-1]|uniref:Uncharacterized protein n=1 Tax=Ganoderma sinense ZZ0214-1 TaxID=1077348 RepID=A0A2G8SNR5_9APHY|nr:hypothetical protein GSI_02115 [Ganoderma sinense ZZ0214-1]